MAYVLVTDSDLASIANEIRSKTGSSAQLAFPSGFVTAIRGMQKGTPKAAATYNPSSSDQVIAAGYYLEGAQTFKKVTASNLSAGNIRAGVTVSVSGIGSVAGSFTSDANASAGHILSGMTAYVNSSKITGTIPSKSGEVIDPRSGRRTLPAGYYLSGDQTIYGVSLSSATAEANFPSSTVNLYETGHYYQLGTANIPSGYYIDSITVNPLVGGNGDANAVLIQKNGNALTFGYIPGFKNQVVYANRFKITYRTFYTSVV